MMTFDLDAGVSLCALLRAAKALSPVAMAAVLQPSNNNTLQVPGETRTIPNTHIKARGPDWCMELRTEVIIFKIRLH